MMTRPFWLGCLALWLGLISDGRAVAGFYTPVMPRDLEKLEVYLITAGYGDELYSLWGHTAIRFKDLESHTDVVANWGLFDFDAPNFGWNFFKGILTYRLGFSNYEDFLRTYVLEKRSVWMDRLNLTPVQKERLLTKLIWNAKPENRPYRYQYFFDNCATRPRDYIDEALGGAFKSRFGKKGLTDFSFRDMVRQHMAVQPFFGMSLDVLMNSNIDRPMSIWEEMFLPLALRKYLQQMPAVDDGGQPRLGETLLVEGRQMLDFPPPPTPRHNGFHIVVLPFAALLCLCLAMAAIRSPLSQRLFWRLLGLTAWGWGGLFGTFGLIMLVAWLFSEHQDLLHNTNLWFFWPTDLVVLAWSGWRWLWQKPDGGADRFEQFALLYGGGHLVAFACAVSLTFVGAISQNTQQIAAYFGPLLIFFWGIVFKRVGMASATNRRQARLAAMEAPVGK